MWIKAGWSFCRGVTSISGNLNFRFSVKRAGLLPFCKNRRMKVTVFHSVLLYLALSGPDQQRGTPSILLKKSSTSDNYDDDDDRKALRSRSEASPGEMAPLVTFSSRCGRASLTRGWFWKWERTFSWIRLHIQTFCWAFRRPCSSPLANLASRYDSILAQTSGMPSPVWEEARTTWGGS